MPTYTTPLPPTRQTGDTPPGGVAGDVNSLTDAVVEVRASVGVHVVTVAPGTPAPPGTPEDALVVEVSTP